MSEPFLERLSRFTPDAGGLDRDTLLFAAGRASARPNRGLTALAGLLAGTQALSLTLFLRPTPPPVAQQWAGAPSARAVAPAPPAPPPTDVYADRATGPGREGALRADADDRPLRGVSFIDRGPTLRAFPLPSPSVVN